MTTPARSAVTIDAPTAATAAVNGPIAPDSRGVSSGARIPSAVTTPDSARTAMASDNVAQWGITTDGVVHGAALIVGAMTGKDYTHLLAPWGR